MICFNKVISSIECNSKNIIIVDNGSFNIDEIKEKFSTIDITSLDKNIGIAAAQNIGIQKALEKGADYIWLSDQDTFYPYDYLTNISVCIKELESKNIKYSVIGPSYIELNRNRLQPFIKFMPFSRKIVPTNGVYFVSHLISSGMIIPCDVFHSVGFKNEALFIDWVDLEWCWRSVSMGYKVIGCGDVVIQHALGDEVVSFFGKKIIIRSSFRHYFMIRNAIYLSLYSDYLTLPMRSEVFVKTLLWMFVFPLWSKNNKIEHFKATFLGFFHGITSQLWAKK